MSVGILLVTHPGVAPALLAAARRVVGQFPLSIDAFEMPFECNVDEVLPAASAAMRKVESDDGVLILVDLYGASPSNVAAKLARLGTPVRRVSGLNLSMLLRVMNYPENTLEAMQSVASLGGRNGVILDEI